MESWFDEHFLSATARDHSQSRWRMAATAAAGLLLAMAVDWRVALAWAGCAVAVDAALQRLMQPIVESQQHKPLLAWATLLLRLVLAQVWSFLGLIFWSQGGPLGQAWAMGVFAVLLLYLVGRRDRSLALAVTVIPVLVSPVVVGVLFPPASAFGLAATLAFTSLMAGLAGAVVLRDLGDAGAETRRSGRAVTWRSRPSADGRAAVDDDALSVEGLREAKAQAEAASQAKSAFLATMSHEIRTPLNGVLGMSQALAADPKLTRDQRAKLDMIRKSGESLLAILNDILDLSKIEAGKLELESIEFDLEEVACSSQASFKAIAVQKGLAFKIAIQPAAKGVYLGDPTRVRQVLFNLISNAVKFTEDGEIKVSIDRAGRDGLRLTVADTGIGMDATQLERIFDKFEQADASSTRRFGGTGLGLAICRDLCGLMGGSISVESEPGCGTRFTVVLPLPKVSHRSVGEARTGADANPEAAAARTLRVLAAEDNPVNQLVLKALLAQVGMEPIMVDNGAQALEAWTIGTYDVILMDVQMPEMDGLEATRAIRREEARTGRARTPILAVTANAMSHHVAEYATVGMDGHVAKPIERTALVAAIEDLVARAQAEAATRPTAARRAG